jgi:hypothetical protein
VSRLVLRVTSRLTPAARPKYIVRGPRLIRGRLTRLHSPLLYLDDNQNSPKTSYLEAAVDATLKGQPVAVKETKGRGCSVKYENK